MGKILKGGVIGFGNMGQGFTKMINSRSDAKITIVCNRGKEKLDIARKDYGLYGTHSAEELLNSDIDFVIITSNSYAHRDQVVMAAEKGKHILCEKPISLNLKEADEMIEAVEKAGVVNVVNYTLRFTPHYKKIKEMVDSGAIGKILSCWSSRSRGSGLYSGGSKHRAIVEPEESGGWIIHHACHNVDFMMSFAGHVKDVYCATQSTFHEKDSEEIIWAIMNFKDGAIGMMGDSVLNLRYESLGVSGEKGTICLDYTEKGKVLRFRKEEAIDNFAFARPGDIIQADEKSDAAENLFNHFFDCIRNDKKSHIREAKASLGVSIALKQSSVEKKIVSLQG